MIVVNLIGGLGNQMFQYAAGKALSLKRKTGLYLDLSTLQKETDNYTKRGFELGEFMIQASVADISTLKNFDLHSNRFILKLKSFFPFLFQKMVFNESGHDFNKRFFNMPSTCYLNGYWQNQRYFRHIRQELLNDFQLRPEFHSETYKLLHDEITGNRSVGVHVRRGDYVTLAGANSFHGVIDIDYYRVATQLIIKQIKDPHFYVFSDDIKWCRENLDFIKNFTLVDGGEKNFNAQHELLLMSACKHNIIANSSFSWWAAWLNTNATKVVVAPLNWFRKEQRQPKNLLPANWIRL